MIIALYLITAASIPLAIYPSTQYKHVHTHVCTQVYTMIVQVYRKLATRHRNHNNVHVLPGSYMYRWVLQMGYFT